SPNPSPPPALPQILLDKKRDELRQRITDLQDFYGKQCNETNPNVGEEQCGGGSCSILPQNQNQRYKDQVSCARNNYSEIQEQLQEMKRKCENPTDFVHTGGAPDGLPYLEGAPHEPSAVSNSAGGPFPQQYTGNFAAQMNLNAGVADNGCSSAFYFDNYTAGACTPEAPCSAGDEAQVAAAYAAYCSGGGRGSRSGTTFG
ncbi:unnamed protein product, partial [Amoebophrya sp. A120]